MSDAYRWGSVTPPSVALLKRRRVHRDSLKRQLAARMASQQTESQSPCSSCAPVVAKAVCVEQDRRERVLRRNSAQLGDA